jgi:hypothetical protein
LGSKRGRLIRTNICTSHFHFFQPALGSEAALGRRSAARFQK